MQSFWDLLPASLWPTQPFIPPDEQARIMQALWVQQASANSLAAASAASANRAGVAQTLAPAALASGGDDVGTAGGILGPVLGAAANSPPATNPPMLPPPTPDSYVSGPGLNAQRTAPLAPMAQRIPGATDIPGIGAGPTAAPGLARAVGDLPGRTRQGAYWLAQHGVDTAPPPPADYRAVAPSQPTPASSTASDMMWSLPRGLMGGFAEFINSAAAADDPDIAWGKYLAGQDLPDIADQQQRQLEEVRHATDEAQRRVRQAVGMPAEASTRAGRLVEGGARFLGNPITWLGGPEGLGAKALTGFLSGVGSEAGGELAAGTKWETPMRLVGSIAGPVAPGVGARAFNKLYDALPSGAGAFGGKLIQPAEGAPSAAPAALARSIDPAPASVLDNANYAQRWYDETFSDKGPYKDRTINDLVADLNSGKLKPSDLTVHYIVRDGHTLIQNTRTAQALERAGIPRWQWKPENKTGDPGHERDVSRQLKWNGLTSAGTPTVMTRQEWLRAGNPLWPE